MMAHDVTQADREAAAEQVRPRDNGMETTQEAIRAGRFDEHRLAQAFAAHRLAAIAEERARVVALIGSVQQAQAASEKRKKSIIHEACFDAVVGALHKLAQSIERGDHIQEK